MSRFVQATSRYFLRVFGPRPTRIGVSSPLITCARMIRHRIAYPPRPPRRQRGRSSSARTRARAPRRSAPGQLRAAVHRDGVHRDQVHALRLQGQAVGDRPGDAGPGRGGSPVHPPAPAGHLVQVMLSHRRGLQRDVHDLVAGGTPRSAAPARSAPHPHARPGSAAPAHPGWRTRPVRSRGAWLPARLAPALTASRLRRRRRAARQVIGGRGHRGIAAVTAQPTPQIPDLRRQRHHVSPQLPDRGGQLLQHAGLRLYHHVPGSARRAARRGGRRQNGHNQPSSSPALSNQHDTQAGTR